MRAKIKFYQNLFDACSDKEIKSIIVYADSKDELYNVIDSLETNYLVINVYVDDGSKKDEKTT